MALLYNRFVKETFDEQDHLLSIELCPPEDFNFGFDVVDELGMQKPDKRAMRALFPTPP
jgi:acetyl-CoA synthetase